MKVALGCELLDGQGCGMRIALDGFLEEVYRLNKATTFELVHGKPFDGACKYDVFSDTVIPHGSGFGSGLLWSQVKIPRALRSMAIDLLHWPCQLLPPIRTSVPLVVSIWDLAPLSFNEPGWSRLAVAGKYKTVLRLSINNAAHIITHSHAIADEVIERFSVPANRISVIYPGLDSIFVQEAAIPRRPTPDGYILYVGTNTPRKNLRLLLEAFSILIRQGVKNHLALRVNFSDSAKAAFIKTAEKMGISSNRIKFISPVAPENLPQIYRDAALFAFPSLYEGFGLPMIEAMACGLPVVALNRSTMPEVLGDVGLLVDEASPSAFARRIVEAITLIRGNSREMEDKVRKRATRFQWTIAVSKTLAVYEAVCGYHWGGQSQKNLTVLPRN